MYPHRHHLSSPPNRESLSRQRAFQRKAVDFFCHCGTFRAVFFAYHAVQQHQRPQLNRHAPNACPRYLRRQDTQNIYEGFLLFPLFPFLLFTPLQSPPQPTSACLERPLRRTLACCFQWLWTLVQFSNSIFVRLAPIPLTSVWEPLFPSPAPWILCCAL